MFGSAGLAYATAALTVTTLFFGELLPKALGVNNAEVVARRVLPVIIVLSVVLNPVAKTFTLISTVSNFVLCLAAHSVCVLCYLVGMYSNWFSVLSRHRCALTPLHTTQLNSLRRL